MPTEVLSYYLKNEDRKVRLGFQVILQCAPFLKGLKVSDQFPKFRLIHVFFQFLGTIEQDKAFSLGTR